MIAGRMKDQITLTAPGGYDSDGAAVAGTAVTLWAEVLAPKMSEAPAQGSAQAACDVQARIRYRSVDRKSTVTYDGKTYSVVGVEWDARKTWTLLRLRQLTA